MTANRTLWEASQRFFWEASHAFLGSFLTFEIRSVRNEPSVSVTVTAVVAKDDRFVELHAEVTPLLLPTLSKRLAEHLEPVTGDPLTRRRYVLTVDY